MKTPNKPMLKIKDLGAPFRATAELGKVVLKTPVAFAETFKKKTPELTDMGSVKGPFTLDTYDSRKPVTLGRAKK